METPKVTQKMPYVIDLNPGKYYWCACGLSKNQPFCDGSHKSTSFTPIMVEITENKKVALCGCKMSKNKPFCDGTHKNL